MEAAVELKTVLSQVADGNRELLEQAFALLHPIVLGFCRRVLGTEAAEDAAQEALISLFAQLHEYDARREPLPWVLAFASNACRTAKKQQLRRRECLESIERSGEDTPEKLLLEAELKKAVYATIHTLSPLDIETLELALGQRPSGATFRKRLERALQRFRAAWSGA
jgi:DNA-directed RNA polymerase specialized sigma24 family protein